MPGVERKENMLKKVIRLVMMFWDLFLQLPIITKIGTENSLIFRKKNTKIVFRVIKYRYVWKNVPFPPVLALKSFAVATIWF